MMLARSTKIPVVLSSYRTLIGGKQTRGLERLKQPPHRRGRDRVRVRCASPTYHQ